MTQPIEISTPPPALARDIYANRWFFWIGGTLSVLFGCLAILMPYVATLAAKLVIGAVLAISGVAETLTAFNMRKTKAIAMRFFLGLLTLAAGIVLLIDPFSGILALTLVLIAFFLASGSLKLYFAWKMRPDAGWSWMALGGVLTLALGFLVLSGLPGSAFWVLGLLVGVDLIFYGTALIATVWSAHKQIKNNSRHGVSEAP